MRLIYFISIAFSVFSNLATALISGRPCNCSEEVVDCSYRSKSQVYLGEKCSNATTGNFEQNKLSDYPEMLTSFTSVNMASNLLTRLPNNTQLNANIVFLDLSQNMIANASKELQYLSSLKILLIPNNRLESLEFLPEPCFLETLLLDNNAITNLQGPLRFCTQMRNLSLDGNQVSNIPANLFAGMAELIELSLNDNPLVTLSDDVLRGPLKLKNLYLSGTNLTNLPSRMFSGTPELKILYLNRNRLRDFPSHQIKGLAALQELRIWGNRIRELPTLINCCPQLQEVVLDWNEIHNPSEQAVLSFVRGNASSLSLLRNPLRLRALRWALASRALRPFAHTHRCGCGGLRHVPHDDGTDDDADADTGPTVVIWCLRVICGSSAQHADWIAAVNASLNTI